MNEQRLIQQQREEQSRKEKPKNSETTRRESTTLQETPIYQSSSDPREVSQSTKEANDNQLSTSPLPQSIMGQDNFNETEDFLSRQQQELLERANSLSLDSTNPLMPLDELQADIPTTSPPKNHLLEQLYRAKPQSLSSTSASTPHNNSAEVNQFGLSEQAPQYFSPNKKSEFNSQLDGFRGMDWRNGAQPFSSHQSTQGIGANQSTSQFSPFNSNAVLDQLHQPPSVDVFLNASVGSNTRPSIQQTNNFLWSTGASRNNSIWNTASSETQHGIWNNNASLQHINNGMLPVGGNRFSLSEQTPMVDVEAVQKAAFDAFTLMLANNQLSFDLAPVMNMFQVVRGLLGNSSMGMSEFLKTLNVPGRYHFDLIHDDRGNATHIKVMQNPANGPHPQMPASMAQLGLQPQLNNNLQFGFSAATQSPFQNQPLQQNMPNVPQQPQPMKSVNGAPQRQHDGNGALKTNGFQLLNSIPGLFNSMGFGQGGGIW